MPKRTKLQAPKDGNPPPAPRRPNGTFLPGYSGRQGLDVGRARRDLNGATIGALREAFDKYGKAAIEKVAKQQPAIFLKMLVLLVPRELEITQTGGVKAMSDEQIAQAIEAIEGMLARRRAVVPGDDAKVIEASPASPVLPQEPAEPSPPDGSTA